MLYNLLNKNHDLKVCFNLNNLRKTPAKIKNYNTNHEPWKQSLAKHNQRPQMC